MFFELKRNNFDLKLNCSYLENLVLLFPLTKRLFICYIFLIKFFTYLLTDNHKVKTQFFL